MVHCYIVDDPYELSCAALLLCLANSIDLFLAFPCKKTASISSSVSLLVSTMVNHTTKIPTKSKMAKMMYVFQPSLSKAVGKAKLCH